MTQISAPTMQAARAMAPRRQAAQVRPPFTSELRKWVGLVMLLAGMVALIVKVSFALRDVVNEVQTASAEVRRVDADKSRQIDDIRASVEAMNKILQATLLDYWHSKERMASMEAKLDSIYQRVNERWGSP